MIYVTKFCRSRCVSFPVDKVLGSCELFEERQVENERFNIFSGCSSGCTATRILRGGVDGWCRRLKYLLHTVELHSSNLNKITNRASVKCEGVLETFATLSILIPVERWRNAGVRMIDVGVPRVF
ncbi:unnamed protein product [Fraxinus pennsylvanica]|uniref:Uncharacterized protein n=1 Tax=Fraxinus pennsylvanica TaxID=56036 RepID=A0AAD1Z588_9LAMI|nr:unnamed protein product [Fraxinus pennsylvanica]